MKLEMITNSPNETIAFAKKIGAMLKGGEVIAYKGGLGAGKTTFTSGLAEGLGLDAEVTSPTFALVNEYSGEGKPTLYHFDMYRIEDADDLYATGFFDYLDGKSVLAIEWSENIEDSLPEDTITINIEFLGEDKRKFTVFGGMFE